MKNGISGVQHLWLFPFEKYSRSQIVLNGEFLTSFPTTQIFRFATTNSTSPSESDDMTPGGLAVKQEISFEVFGSDGHDLQQLLKKDYRVIFLDRNGNYRLFGLFNGMEAGTLSYTTGGAKNETNGFKIAFSGQEQRHAPFIANLEAVGLFDDDLIYRITEDGEFRIVETGEYRIVS